MLDIFESEKFFSDILKSSLQKFGGGIEIISKIMDNKESEDNIFKNKENIFHESTMTTTEINDLLNSDYL